MLAAAGVFAGVGAYQQYQFAQFERALNANSQRYLQALNNQTQQYQQGLSQARQPSGPLAGARMQPPSQSSRPEPAPSDAPQQYVRAHNAPTHQHAQPQAPNVGNSGASPQPYVPQPAGQAHRQSAAPQVYVPAPVGTTQPTNSYSYPYTYNFGWPSSPYNFTPSQNVYYYYSPPPNWYYSYPGVYYCNSRYYGSYYYGSSAYYSGNAPTYNYTYTEPTGNFFDSPPVPYSRWQDRERNFGFTTLPTWQRDDGSASGAPIVRRTPPRFGIGGTQDFRSRRPVQWMRDDQQKVQGSH
jgi:hypothetical protein